MNSKKPFLIFCAAAVTLSVMLPFLGVLSFAASDTSVSVSFMNSGSYPCQVYCQPYGSSPNGFQLTSGQSRSVSFVYDTVYQFRSYVSSQSLYCQLNYKFTNTGPVYSLSTDPDNPTVFSFGGPYPFLFYSLNPTSSSAINYYVFFDGVPDPLAPVSDGMDTMISVFGDVIDYIINTPDVAIFVAISVASCAIIPMGIILIKKLIKGY